MREVDPRGERLFTRTRPPGQDKWGIHVQDGIDGERRAVLDPNRWAPTQTLAPSSRTVACSCAPTGSRRLRGIRLTSGSVSSRTTSSPSCLEHPPAICIIVGLQVRVCRCDDVVHGTCRGPLDRGLQVPPTVARAPCRGHLSGLQAFWRTIMPRVAQASVLKKNAVEHGVERAYLDSRETVLDAWMQAENRRGGSVGATPSVPPATASLCDQGVVQYPSTLLALWRRTIPCVTGPSAATPFPGTVHRR